MSPAEAQRPAGWPGRTPGPATADQAAAWMWVALALLVAGLHTTVAFLTQGTTAGLLAAVVWGGALLCVEDRVPAVPPSPSAAGAALGLALLAWGLWRTAQIVDLDVVSHGLPLALGLGLALLYVPLRRLREFRDALLVLALLSVAMVYLRTVPVGPLSELTAQVTRALLWCMGIDARVEGVVVWLGTAGVNIGGPCSGNDTMAQLLVVSGIFLLAFRLRAWWRRVLVLLMGQALAVLGNGLRIALLAIVTASDWPSKLDVFTFFHDEYGALLFAGLTVGVFGWLYLRVLEPELKAPAARPAHG